MAGRNTLDDLAEVVAATKSKILKYRGNRAFNEQNTKASLIVPVLQVLGWDTNDPDEVHWEYKPKPKYNPVDFALLLARTPCLLLEAKALRESLIDDKLTAQILTYASVAGVQWVVLSNGDEYRIYNATAPVPIEDKLFRSVSLSASDASSVIPTLTLLSKRDLQDKKISRLWDSHFVDRQVKARMEDLLNPEEPARAVVQAISRLSSGRLRDSEVRASLRRMRIQFDFPAEPETPPTKTRSSRKADGRAIARQVAPGDAERKKAQREVTLDMLIQDRILQVPAKITCKYRGRDLTGTIEASGKVTVGGKTYDSLSVAGGMARKPYFDGELKWGPCPPTNGWTFWSVSDPATGKVVPMSTLRDRYLESKATEAELFRRGDR